MPFRASLQAIIDELRVPGTLTPAVLSAALRRHNVTLDDVAPWVRFDASGYARNLITRDARWELRLLCWRPGQSSSVHTHGNSACAFRIVRGTASESVLGERDRAWTPGAVVEETMPLVHQVSNQSSDPLVTLHAYSPALPVDAPSPADGHTVVIVGGGFAGVAAAYHLLKHGSSSRRILVVERGPWLGRGIAYGVESPSFKLNVPAAKMSIDPELPNDFVEWAGGGDTAQAFLPRASYAKYVEQALARAVRGSPAKLRLMRGEVTRIDSEGVHVADGRRLRAESVVLATGMQPRTTTGWVASNPRIVEAWDECALATLPTAGRILLLGAGLTALDVMAILHDRGFLGQVEILSRHGLLPRAHLDPRGPLPTPRALPSDLPHKLRDWVHWLRERGGEAQKAGEPWQLTIDSLRPHSARIWAALSTEDRRRFVRHVRPYWDVLRHRAPPESAALVSQWKQKGNLTVSAGRIVECVSTSEALRVKIRGRDGRMREERFDALVRCLGPALELSESPSTLFGSLIRSGMAIADPAGLGILTDAVGRVLPRSGVTGPPLFALGAVRRASSWETIAVPEIARHASEIVRELKS